MAKDLALLDSGTSALTLALRLASRERSGLPCLLPAFGCFDLATAALGAEVPVRFYDVDPHSLSPDIDSLRRGLAGGASGVVVAHLYGVPANLDEVLGLVKSAGSLLIEDAAQGVGGTWRGRPLGSFGDFSILSFGRGKGLTGGSGGVLLFHSSIYETADGDLAPATSNSLLAASVAIAQELLSCPTLYAIPANIPFLGLGVTRFRHPTPCKHMSPYAMSLVLRNDALMPRESTTRRLNACWVATTAQRYGLPAVKVPSAAHPGWLRFPIPPTTHGPNLAPAPALGVMRSYPVILPSLPALSARLTSGADYPGALQLANGLVTLPTHSRLVDGDRSAIEKWMAQSGIISVPNQ